MSSVVVLRTDSSSSTTEIRLWSLRILPVRLNEWFGAVARRQKAFLEMRQRRLASLADGNLAVVSGDENDRNPQPRSEVVLEL